jgi:tRNA threonylcarbamoyl adenosine modification protein YjeE
MMDKYTDTTKLTPEVRSLLPGSYTIVLPSLHTASPLLEAEDGTVGVRLIGNQILNSKFEILTKEISLGDFVTSLVAQYGKPLTATSANISGGGLCYSPDAFFHQLSEVKKELVDAVVDAGELPHNPPSTVIHLASHAPVILRANDQNYIHHETRIMKHESETADFAGAIYERVKDYLGVKPIVVLLDGELGGGKTTWTKYFAEHFGVQGIVSPTYTYECEYKVQNGGAVTRFKHYDLYNITQPEDIAYLEIAKHCTVNTVSCIEWSGQLSHEERVRIANTTYLVRILFEYVGERERKVSVWWN